MDIRAPTSVAMLRMMYSGTQLCTLQTHQPKLEMTPGESAWVLLTDVWSGASLGRRQQHIPAHLQPLPRDTRRHAGMQRPDVFTSSSEKHKSILNFGRIH